MGKKTHGKEGKVSFYEFFQRFPDEESAERYFAEKRWGKDGKDRFCPHCGSIKTVRTKDRMPYRCKDCRKRFSVRTRKYISGKQSTSSQMVNGCLSAEHELKRSVQYETRKRLRRTAKNGVVSCSQNKGINERGHGVFH